MSHAAVLFQPVCQANSEVEQLSRHFSQNIYFYTIWVWNKKFFMRRSYTTNLFKGLILSVRIDICLIHSCTQSHPPTYKPVRHWELTMVVLWGDQAMRQLDLQAVWKSWGHAVREWGRSAMKVMRSCYETVGKSGNEESRGHSVREWGS